MNSKDKKRLSSVTLMLVLAIFIMLGCVRITTFQTVLNEDFQLHHQKKSNYYAFIYKNLMQELIDISNEYELPDTLTKNFVKPVELELMIQEQTVELLKLNRGERDTFPTVNLSYLAEDYVWRALMYVESHNLEHLLNDKRMQQQFFEEIDATFNKHLKIVDYDEYYNNEKMILVHNIYDVIVSKLFNVFIWISILCCGATLIWMWRTQITQIFYVCSGSLMIAGGSLVLLFIRLNRFIYSITGVSTDVGKEILFEITMTSMLKHLSFYGTWLFSVGFISMISVLVGHQKKLLMHSYFE